MTAYEDLRASSYVPHLFISVSESGRGPHVARGRWRPRWGYGGISRSGQGEMDTCMHACRAQARFIADPPSLPPLHHVRKLCLPSIGYVRGTPVRSLSRRLWRARRRAPRRQRWAPHVPVSTRSRLPLAEEQLHVGAICLRAAPHLLSLGASPIDWRLVRWAEPIGAGGKRDVVNVMHAPNIFLSDKGMHCFGRGEENTWRTCLKKFNLCNVLLYITRKHFCALCQNNTLRINAVQSWNASHSNRPLITKKNSKNSIYTFLNL